MDSTTTVTVSSGPNSESFRRNESTTPPPSSHGTPGLVAPQNKLKLKTEFMLELDHIMDNLLHDMEDDANEGLVASNPTTVSEKDFPDDHER